MTVFGNREPTLKVESQLAVDFSEGDKAIALMTAYSSPPDPWQGDVLKQWLARQESGKLAHKISAASISRRSGKSWLLVARMVYGLLGRGEQIIYTSHVYTTTREIADHVFSFFEDDRYPELKSQVAKLYRNSGSMSIKLKNGGQLKFLARTPSSGRGLKADLLIIDEAQHYGQETASSLTPVVSSAPKGDSQQILVGTPEVDSGSADIFKGIRNRALDGELAKACYHEWSMEKDDDLDDIETWKKANPSLGLRLDVEDVQAERIALSDRAFAIERLGSWDANVGTTLFEPDLWANLTDETSQLDNSLVLAIDVNPMRTCASISVAGYRKDGKFHVETIENRASGVAWVVPRIREIAEKQNIKTVVFDSGGPAGALADDLSRLRGIKLKAIGARDVANAAGKFFDAVINGDLHHLSQPALNISVTNASRRKIGDAWGFSRNNNAIDLTPLVSCSFALWGVGSPTVKKTRSKTTETRTKGRALFL